MKGEKKLAAKSILGVMGAAIRPGEKITLITDGADEETAMAALEKFLSAK